MTRVYTGNARTERVLCGCNSRRLKFFVCRRVDVRGWIGQATRARRVRLRGQEIWYLETCYMRRARFFLCQHLCKNSGSDDSDQEKHNTDLNSELHFSPPLLR